MSEKSPPPSRRNTLTNDEMLAMMFLVEHFIAGRPATPREVSTALAILAKERPFSAMGRVTYLAMIRNNMARLEARRDEVFEDVAAVIDEADSAHGGEGATGAAGEASPLH